MARILTSLPKLNVIDKSGFSKISSLRIINGGLVYPAYRLARFFSMAYGQFWRNCAITVTDCFACYSPTRLQPNPTRVLGNLVRTESVIAFLRRKWDRELGYRLRKELWGFRENRMAVTFFYEWHDDSGQWYRSYGNELWEFAPSGLMVRRIASINDAPIHESDRQLRQ